MREDVEKIMVEAKRYRYLRDGNGKSLENPHVVKEYGGFRTFLKTLTGKALDREVDRAMRK